MTTHTTPLDSLAGEPPRRRRRTALGSGPRPRGWLSRLIGIVFVLALLAAVWSAWDPNAIRAWKQEASPLAYFAAMAALPAIGMPLTPFYIVAGAMFPLPWALLGSLLAVVANFSLCHVIAQSGMKRVLQSALAKFGYELPDFQGGEGALRFTLLVRLTPGLPNFAKNYLLGVSGVPFATYLAGSTGTTLLYGVPSIVLGGSLFQHDGVSTAVIVGVIALLAALAWRWYRRAPR